MKRLLIAALMFVAIGAWAQTGEQVQAAVHDLSQADTPGKWAGKLDFKTLTPGAYASVYNTDSVEGVGLRAWHLDKGTQDILNVGLFVGIHRYGVLGTPTKGIGGGTFQIPGSLLDFALGTKMGDMWVPKLKTGIFGGWDFVRPKDLKARPDFIGFGAGYPFGL